MAIPKEDKRRFSKLLEKALNDPRECLTPSCGMPAINSHVLQQKGGILDSISTDGMIMERVPAMPFHPRKIVRKSVKTSDVLGFIGFCGHKHNNCDARLFSEIENQTPDFSNYRHNLLFAYRAHMCLERKAEAWDEAYLKIMNINSTSSEVKLLAQQYFTRHAEISRWSKQVSYLLEKEVFSDDINEPKGFSFVHRVLPKYFEIAACSTSSSFVTLNSIEDSAFKTMLETHQFLDDGLVPIAFSFALIPVKGALHLVIGYPIGVTEIEGVPVNLFETLNSDDIYKFVSDVLMRRIETWCMSIAFYNQLKSHWNFDGFMINTQGYRDPRSWNTPTVFNLFTGLI
ncbi:hypothetical protein [Hymenobacter rubidus]|uniref:hypothetical protein n=1 Tax=Hymenobacter rubidus TaxID=1441626 RepID=UPI00191EC2DB|nr:hypothetical protein [Hymenobacter rubidus]